jgi:hypothetical protein
MSIFFIEMHLARWMMKTQEIKKGDLVNYKDKERGIGIVTSVGKCNSTKVHLYFVRYPHDISNPNWGCWTHPTRLEVISESR